MYEMDIKALIEVNEEDVQNNLICKNCNRKLCICKGEKWDRIVRCYICKKEMKYKGILRHIKEVHKKEKRNKSKKKFIKGQGISFIKVKCKFCDKRVLGKNLKRHKERFHKE